MELNGSSSAPWRILALAAVDSPGKVAFNVLGVLLRLLDPTVILESIRMGAGPLWVQVLNRKV